MTDYNDKIRAVVLAALMVLSVFAGTVAFTGTAAAAQDISDATAGNVQGDTASTTHTITSNVTVTAGASGETVTVNYAAGNVTSASSVTVTGPDSSDVTVAAQPSASITGNGQTSFTFDLTDSNAESPDEAEDVTVSIDVTHNLTGVGADGTTSTVTFTDGSNSASADFAIEQSSSDRAGPAITNTAYLGEEGVSLRGVSGIAQTGSVTLYGVAGEADGSTAQVGDVASADITADNDFTTGGYSVQSGDDTVELSVVEPRVTGLTIYRGPDESGADVTDGSVLTDDQQITVEGEFNFEDAEPLDLIIEDDDGLEVQTGLTGSPADQQIDTSGGNVTLSGIDTLDTGEYTVTLEGEDVLDGTSRSATFTIRDEAQTISLSESTATKGDSVVATVTGTPGTYAIIKIDAEDTTYDSGDMTNTNASTIFANTGDVVSPIFGTNESATFDTEDDWAVVQVELGDDGEASVRVETEEIDDGTTELEFTEGGTSALSAGTALNNLIDADENETVELTVEEKSINVTSTANVVRIGEQFDIEGTAPESDNIKAYARVDENWVPLAEEVNENSPNDAAETDVDSDGSFTLTVDSGTVISLPDSYRIGLVADADQATDVSTIDSGTPALSDEGTGDVEISSSEFSDFDTTETFSVRTVEGDLTAQVSTDTIASNVDDEVTLSGTALGQGDELRVYLIGPRGNYLNVDGDSQNAETVDIEDEEFSEDYNAFDRRGTYTFIVVGQGRDGSFSNDGTDDVGFDGSALRSDLTPQQAVEIINDAYTGAGSDDQIVELTVQAENPELTIDDFTTDGQVAQGEVTISGTSNREDETTVFIEVLGQNENVIASTEAEVNGSSSSWETTIDMSDVETGTYTLRADDDEASASLEFELVGELSTPTETPAPDTETPEPDTATPEPDTATPEPDTATPEPETETTTSTSTPGFGAIVALVALIAAALLAIRRD